jgi:hypothetical protein
LLELRTIAANQLQRLNLYPMTPVTYIYIDAYPENMRDLRFTLSSLLVQLLQFDEWLKTRLKRRFYEVSPASSTKLEIGELWYLLMTSIGHFEKTILVLSGLNDYRYGVEGFLEDFSRLLESQLLSIFMTSEPVPTNNVMLPKPTPIGFRASETEIRVFIERALREQPYPWKHVLLQHAHAREKIILEIINKSHGV